MPATLHRSSGFARLRLRLRRRHTAVQLSLEEVDSLPAAAFRNEFSALGISDLKARKSLSGCAKSPSVLHVGRVEAREHLLRGRGHVCRLNHAHQREVIRVPE